MYDIKATLKRDALVTPGSVFLFALGNNQRVPLNQEGGEWLGPYSVRCQGSFPLQIPAEWKLQGFAVRPKLLPLQPRQVKLTEPPFADTASLHPPGKPPQ